MVAHVVTRVRFDLLLVDLLKQLAQRLRLTLTIVIEVVVVILFAIVQDLIKLVRRALYRQLVM